MAYLKCGFITVYCSLILWKLNSSCQPAVLGAYNAKYLCLPQLFSCSKVVWASKVLHTVFLKNKCFLFLFGGTALLHMSMLRIRRVRVQTSCTLEKNCTTQLSHSTVECSFLNLPCHHEAFIWPHMMFAALLFVPAFCIPCNVLLV